MNIKPMIGATNQKMPTDEEKAELKFKLYLKNRKVVAISKIMDEVLLWPKKNRSSWGKKFSPEISSLLDEMLEEAVEVFDGATLDSELMGLFAEFTQNLKTITKQVEGVVGTARPIDA